MWTNEKRREWQSSDIWAVGLLLKDFVALNIPFYGQENFEKWLHVIETIICYMSANQKKHKVYGVVSYQSHCHWV